MSADKYPGIFSRQMEAIVYIFAHQMEAIVYVQSHRRRPCTSLNQLNYFVIQQVFNESYFSAS